jgi:hypothetical protein
MVLAPLFMCRQHLCGRAISRNEDKGWFCDADLHNVEAAAIFLSMVSFTDQLACRCCALVVIEILEHEVWFMTMKLVSGVESRGSHQQIGLPALTLVRKCRIPIFFWLRPLLKAPCAIVGMLLILNLSLVGSLQAAQDESKALRERATAFWEARVKGDYGTVYDYLSGSEVGSATKEEYVNFTKEKGPFVYLSYKLGEVDVDGETGWVNTAFDIRPLRFPGYPPNHIEQWLVWEKVDGKWYPIPKERQEEEPKLPPRLRPLKEERAVIARANEFWQAREKADYALLYEYLSPIYTKQIPKEEFLGKKAFYVYVDHEIHWAEIEGDHAKVRVTVGTRPSDPNLTKLDPSHETTIQEWIKVKGQWYLDVPNEG